MESQAGLFGALEVAQRQYDLQWEAEDYLRTHPEAAVVNLGCGLDLSFDAIDNGSCRYINMDLPDVIEAREKIVSCKGREFNLAGDLMDFEWMERVKAEPYNVDVGEGVFIISGGVLMYFSTEQMKRFFLAAAHAFPGGGICFDGENERGLQKSNKIVRKTGNGSKVDFPIDNAEKLFSSWGPCFTKITERPMPSYIKRSKEIPFKWKFVLSMGLRMGIVKIIEVSF